jgi:hypothetical protein
LRVRPPFSLKARDKTFVRLRNQSTLAAPRQKQAEHTDSHQ